MKADKPPLRMLRAFLWVIGGLILAVGLLLVAVTNLDDHRSRRLIVNEVSALSTLRTIAQLQDEYNAAHAYTGFACELSKLKPLTQQESEFLTTGLHSGYRFSLVSCSADANRARVSYQITAVPVQQGKTGVRVFCADESGSIWYDLNGSATDCLASRRILE